jgi:hypothetical protein
MKNFLNRLTKLFGSRAFFIGIIVFFVIEAVWIALSAIYPMPFDEDFHFGLIKIYATHWSPFLTSHPDGADAFGAVTRDPSYLYHYLMSFPYRLLTHIVSDETTRIIILRLINVAFFTYALVLFRKVLLRLTHSPAFTHVALGVFVLIPIVPQLAAHINYDNLLMVLVAWACLLVTDIHREFTAGRFELRSLLALLVLALFSSVVKYSFLPIFAAIVIFLCIDGFTAFRTWDKLKKATSVNFKGIAPKTRIGMLLLLVLGGLFFFQRFGVNMIKYHTPVPSCDQVLNYNHCSAYGPWIRDYNYAQERKESSEIGQGNPIKYSGQWVEGLWWRLFFAINSSARNYTNYPPLPFPSITAVILASAMTVLFIIYFKRIVSRPLLLFSLLVIIFYCGALWLDNYKMYTETGHAVAVNGRYLIPVLPLMATIGWRGFWILTQRMQQVRPALAMAVLLLFLQGGGLFTFIMRSDASWYWPNNSVIKVNDTARNILDPFIIQGSKHTKTVL